MGVYKIEYLHNDREINNNTNVQSRNISAVQYNNFLQFQCNIRPQDILPDAIFCSNRATGDIYSTPAFKEHMKDGKYVTMRVSFEDQGVFPYRITKALLNISASSVCSAVEKAYNSLQSNKNCKKIVMETPNSSGYHALGVNALGVKTSSYPDFFYGLGFAVDFNSVSNQGVDERGKHWRAVVREYHGSSSVIVKNTTSGLVDYSNRNILYMKTEVTSNTVLDIFLQYLDENESVLGHARLSTDSVRFFYVPKSFECKQECISLQEKLASYFKPGSNTIQCKTAAIEQGLSEFSDGAVCKGRCTSF